MCEIELSHIGKNSRNPDLVCEKYLATARESRPENQSLTNVFGFNAPSTLNKLIGNLALILSVSLSSAIFRPHRFR